MISGSAIAELERRVRTVEEELNGQRHVKLFQVEQAIRNSEVLHAVSNEAGAATTRIDHIAGDMAAVKAALAMHGRALDVVMQDIRQLRAGQDEINARLDRMQEETAARHGEVLAAIRALAGGAVPPA
jgi:chromosome segregation ATPase